MLSVIERTCAVTAVALLALSGAACSTQDPAPVVAGGQGGGGGGGGAGRPRPAEGEGPALV
ncbi:hypothetical protein, partial [Saccharopolyspora sp. 6V]|uniref:hypothetical protein n=1 Tax=Saccharopolyspora sp. 6V TaxID=2877239 RepID=UPI001CD2F84F